MPTYPIIFKFFMYRYAKQQLAANQQIRVPMEMRLPSKSKISDSRVIIEFLNITHKLSFALYKLYPQKLN